MGGWTNKTWSKIALGSGVEATYSPYRQWGRHPTDTPAAGYRPKRMCLAADRTTAMPRLWHIHIIKIYNPVDPDTDINAQYSPSASELPWWEHVMAHSCRMSKPNATWLELPWTCVLWGHIWKYLGWVDNEIYAHFHYHHCCPPQIRPLSSLCYNSSVFAIAGSTIKTDFLQLCAGQSVTVPEFRDILKTTFS